MGGYTYTTKEGDMWDYIAYKVYGNELMMTTLFEAEENRELLNIYIFSAGTEVWCPYVEDDSDADSPEWNDDDEAEDDSEPDDDWRDDE